MTEERLQQTELQSAARQHDHLVNREMILAKAKELAGILGSSEEVQVFRKAEEKDSGSWAHPATDCNDEKEAKGNCSI